MNQYNRPHQQHMTSLDQSSSTTSPHPADAQQVRQQLLRMILRNEAERKARLKPNFDLDAIYSTAELRIGT